MYVHAPTGLQALFPIGAYVAELRLDLQWSGDRARALLPGQDAIELELEGATAYIYEGDAQRLRAMRQQLRARARVTRAVADRSCVMNALPYVCSHDVCSHEQGECHLPHQALSYVERVALTKNSRRRSTS